MHAEAYDPAEFWSRDQIEATQLTRLKNVVSRVYNKCEFYRKRLDEAGVSPDSIKSLDDIERIPFTTKDDLRSQYPLGLVIVDKADLVRLHCSSGTTGTPVAIAHTQNDLNTWADLMARCLHMVGVRREDVFQNMSGYGLFTGGLGIHAGAERLGCMTIPAGAGNTARQIKLVKDFHTTVAHILPSYALILGERLREMGEDPADFPLRIAVVGAEPYTDAFRRRIESLFNMKVYNSYGLSEMNGPSVGFECLEQNGLHVWEDAYFAEIVDPETGKHVKPGEVGELVMTTLVREGMPILRYRTRDLTRFLPGTCPCGREHRRIALTASLAAATTCSSARASTSTRSRSRTCSCASPKLAATTSSCSTTTTWATSCACRWRSARNTLWKICAFCAACRQGLPMHSRTKSWSRQESSLCRATRFLSARARQCASGISATASRKTTGRMPDTDCLPRDASGFGGVFS